MATRKKKDKSTATETQSDSSGKKKRSYLSQTDIPGCSLEQAIRIPRAIADEYAGGPATPLQVASALNMSPTSGGFRQLCGAAIAYGLTEGGYNATEITILPTGMRIVRPLDEGQDLDGKREAVIKPRVIGEFLKKYDRSPLPRPEIARNVLEQMGVPKDKTESAYALIIESAESVGLLREIKNKQYVDLTGVPLSTSEEGSNEELGIDGTADGSTGDTDETAEGNSPDAAVPARTDEASRRVFITHGKNKVFIDPIKKLLGFGELRPVVSVDKQSVSKPVPDKVMGDMRSCGAAIIHVDADKVLIDGDGNEHTIINPNVLIEVGAAMALYGRRFILLVREGIELPSNLQGLYEVRYEGDSLDGEATIRLLEAINDIKNHPLPDRYNVH